MKEVKRREMFNHNNNNKDNNNNKFVHCWRPEPWTGLILQTSEQMFFHSSWITVTWGTIRIAYQSKEQTKTDNSTEGVACDSRAMDRITSWHLSCTKNIVLSGPQILLGGLLKVVILLLMSLWQGWVFAMAKSLAVKGRYPAAYVTVTGLSFRHGKKSGVCISFHQ